MDTTKLWTWLKTLPLSLRIIVMILLSALVVIASLSSSACGQIVKVTVRDSPQGVEITTSQTKKDSSATNIHVSPTINFPYGPNSY